jgi:hypothetical protein
MNLSDAELSGLDLIIEMHKAGNLPQGFINVQNIVNDANNLANNVGNAAEAVAAVTAAVAAVAAVAAGAFTPPATIAGIQAGAVAGAKPGTGVSLQTLMAIRKKALDDKSAGKP